MGSLVTFAAVVVSYNRLELLKKCLAALTSQTRPLDEIIVVDNGSNDGSAEYVEQNYPSVTLFKTGANLGGAGGFAWGVEIALAHGHRGAWLMDDDAEPELDAVAPIIELFDAVDPAPAFVASLVTAGRGTFNERNPPVISTDAQRQVLAHSWGGIAVDTATFVGVMVNLELAARTELPVSDFFIWMDDSEYTARLSRTRIAVMLPQSMINHPNNKPLSNDMAGRLFYFLRNRIWYLKSKKPPISHAALEIVSLILHSCKQLIAAGDKKLWLVSVVRGFSLGLFTRPSQQRPGDLLKTLSPGQREKLMSR